MPTWITRTGPVQISLYSRLSPDRDKLIQKAQTIKLVIQDTGGYKNRNFSLLVLLQKNIGI